MYGSGPVQFVEFNQVFFFLSLAIVVNFERKKIIRIWAGVLICFWFLAYTFMGGSVLFSAIVSFLFFLTTERNTVLFWLVFGVYSLVRNRRCNIIFSVLYLLASFIFGVDCCFIMEDLAG